MIKLHNAYICCGGQSVVFKECPYGDQEHHIVEQLALDNPISQVHCNTCFAQSFLRQIWDDNGS